MGIGAYRTQCAARFTTRILKAERKRQKAEAKEDLCLPPSAFRLLRPLPSMIELTRNAAVPTTTLNRPEKLNAFAGTMREDLVAALRGLERDPDCRTVIITGAGRAFCAGGDVAFMRELQQRRDIESFSKLLRAGGEI